MRLPSLFLEVNFTGMKFVVLRFIAIVITPTMCGLALFSMLLLFISIGVVIDTAWWSAKRIHDIALPSIAVGFATSMFPWQLGGNGDCLFKKLSLLYGKMMFTGCLIATSAYAGYWALTSGSEIDRRIAICGYYGCAIFAVVGCIAWIVGLICFYVSFGSYVTDWDKEKDCD